MTDVHSCDQFWTVILRWFFYWRIPPVPPSGRESPDMDFLEMDFDPSDSDDDEPLGNDERQGAVGTNRNRNRGMNVWYLMGRQF